MTSHQSPMLERSEIRESANYYTHSYKNRLMTPVVGHSAISKSPVHSRPKAHCFINRVGILIAAFELLILSRPCEAQIDVYGFFADINSNPGQVSMFDSQ